MVNITSLEDRSNEIASTLNDTPNAHLDSFYNAGLRNDVAFLMAVLGFPDDTRKNPLENLVVEFYTGISNRIRVENDPFEKAFFYLATQPSFVPIANQTVTRRMVKTLAKEASALEKAYADLIVRKPEEARRQQQEVQIDHVAAIDSTVLDQAGFYLMTYLKRDIKTKESYTAAVQTFKKLIERVVKLGRIIPQGVEQFPFPNTIEMLKTVSQNTERFISRYASLYGFKTPPR